MTACYWVESHRWSNYQHTVCSRSADIQQLFGLGLWPRFASPVWLYLLYPVMMDHVFVKDFYLSWSVKMTIVGLQYKRAGTDYNRAFDATV